MAGEIGSPLVMLRADPVGACAAAPWCSAPVADHQARGTETPKEFLCWEGRCHSTLHWGDRRPLNAGASPLPC